MTNNRYYASKIAIDARTCCIDNNIIHENTRKLDFETLQNIVNNFGGNLFKDENSCSYYRHINKSSSFEICIGNDVISEDESITILTALGISFFDINKLLDNCVIYIAEDRLHEAIVKYGISYNEILWFSKEFLMPENLYDESMVEHITADGKFDCIEISKDFDTGYMKVLSRGEDLGKWY